MSAEKDDRASIEEFVGALRVKLDQWAQSMAAKYSGRVYLIGSVLYSPTPRDVDIRIIVPDHEFAARFGYEMRDLPEPVERGPIIISQGVCWDIEVPSQRWVDDIAKTAGSTSCRIGHNVDLKVWPESHWREKMWPRPLLLAGPSERRFVETCFSHVPEEAD